MKDDAGTRNIYENDKVVKQKTITIKPGSGKAVGLGVYKSSTHDPQVRVTFQPDLQDDIGVTHERLDIPGKSQYVLLYLFQNFSHESCRVTMHVGADAVHA